MIKKYLEDSSQPPFSSLGYFKANLIGKELLVPPPPRHGWQGMLEWAQLSVEGSMSGQSNVSLQGENQNK